MNLELFTHNPNDNLLPYDGIVNNYGAIYDVATAQIISDYLMSHIAWQHDSYHKGGLHIISKRKVAWYADAGLTYHYAGTVKPAQVWSPALQKLKQRVERVCNTQFNACLLNLYHNGEEGMGWHCDDEAEIISNSPIASLSFGAERKFKFKHKSSKEVVDLWLASGQLIVMTGSTQKHWLHSIPKSKKINEARINLTFRQMIAV